MWEKTHRTAPEALDCKQKSQCLVTTGMQPCTVQLKPILETTKRTETLNNWTSN